MIQDTGRNKDDLPLFELDNDLYKFIKDCGYTNTIEVDDLIEVLEDYLTD